MRTAKGLVQDFIHQAQRFQLRRSDIQGFRCFGRTTGILPQNSRAAFRRDHGIRRVLQHVSNVADRNGQRPPRAALADDIANHRHPEARQHVQVVADGFRLAALLGTDSRIRTRRIDKGNDGQAKFFSELHHAQGFAIAFRLWHAEVAILPLLGITAFLMADNHDALAVKSCQPANDGWIVGKAAIAVQFLEIGRDHGDIVEGVRPLRMPRHLRNLPSGKFGVNIFGQTLAFFRQLVDFGGDVDRRIVLHVAQLLDLGFQLGNRLFEIEKIEFWCAHAQVQKFASGNDTKSRGYNPSMANRLSKIITRTGDDGTTGLGDGTRIRKDALRVQVLGDIDELNSTIGLLLVELPASAGRATLAQIQNDLFDLGGEICIPGRRAIEEPQVAFLDQTTMDLNATLAPLKEFILPGGSRPAALCHVARTVARRAERSLVALKAAEPISTLTLQYLNRLSDFLFVLARTLNRDAGIADSCWQRDPTTGQAAA